MSEEKKKIQLNGEKIAHIDKFSGHNHILITEMNDDGSAKGHLTVTPESTNPMKIVHGGALMSLADVVAGWGVANAAQGNCVTVNTSFQFLKAAKGTNEKIYCVTKPQKMGRTICVIDVELSDDAGKIVATGVYTFYITGAIG